VNGDIKYVMPECDCNIPRALKMHRPDLEVFTVIMMMAMMIIRKKKKNVILMKVVIMMMMMMMMLIMITIMTMTETS
jgi:hypothetical protein